MIRALVSIPFFRRYMSAVLAVALTTSIVVGTGFAAPTASRSATDTVPVAEGVQGDGAGGGGGTAGPTEPAPAPKKAPDPAPETPAASPGDASGPEVVTTTVETEAPAPAGKTLAAAAAAPLAPSSAPYASSASDWQEWRTTPNAGWVKANLGKAYQEGDWISTRIYVDNRSGAGDLRFPGFKVQFDALNSTKNAIACDDATGFKYWSGTSLPSGEAVPGGATDISGLFSTGSPTAPTFTVTMAQPATDLVIKKGEVGIVYFKFHLAITQYWMAQAGHRGAGYYPGSSAQGTFVSWNGGGVGSQTISVPVGADALPCGEIIGKKFEDRNGDGVRQSNEPYLPGWTLKLTYKDPKYGFTLTGVTASPGDKDQPDPGMYHFRNLPGGSYSLTEVIQDGWRNTTALPVNTTLCRDGLVCLWIGNAQKLVHKIFTLKLTSPAKIPAGASYFVSYRMGGTTYDKPLTGGPPSYKFEIDLPWNTVIDWYRVYAKVGSEIIWLGEAKDGEKLCSTPVTNPWEFTPGSICGSKMIDTDHNGTPDKPGVGWTIKLYRLNESKQPVPVAETKTDSAGLYVFDGLLPGTYFVSEVEDPNFNRLVPAGENKFGPFVVESCSAFPGNDFVNQRKAAELKITKTADKTCVHVDDKIQYTITVSNPGDLDLTNVHVTDPKLGLDYTFPTLAKGTSMTVPLGLTTYTAKDSDGTLIHNVVTATGTSACGPVGPVTAAWDVCVLHPAITLVKSVQPTSITVTEDNKSVPVTYSYLITNTGDTDLTVTLVDDKLGVILGAGGKNGPAITLEAGKSTTVVVAGVPISKPTHNIAIAEGVDKCGKKVSAKSEADVAVNVIKTFKLKLTSAAAKADGYFVRYEVAGQSADLPLVSAGGGIYSATATMAWGTEIAKWQFFATSGQEKVAITGILGPEVLKCAKTNNGEYTPGEISGHKFVGSLTENTPAKDWTIYLYRNGGTEPYMTTMTDSSGKYAFSGLLPGSYTVSELESPNYTRIKPAAQNKYGPFEVKSCSSFCDNDFINQPKTARLVIEKSADKTCVHVDDKIQYTIKVTNPGDLPLTDVHVTDAKLGLDTWIPTLAVGESATIPLEKTTYVAKESDGTLIHNVAIASGTSPFGPVGPVTAEWNVCVIHPAITLVKTVEPTCVTLTEDKTSQPVTYKYVITNTGDTDLTVTLVDDKLGTLLGEGGKLGPAIMLEAGESTTVYYENVPISEPTENLGTAKGTDKLGKKVCATDPAEVCVKLIKTFELTLKSPVYGADGYFVRYTIDDETTDLELDASGEGVYSKVVTLSWGDTIDSWQFFAMVGDGEVALTDPAGPETLKAAKTNYGEYEPGRISGRKFVGTLEKNVPAEGWVINLYRNGGTEPYMTDTTDANGEYSFEGLLPGTYTVSEVEQKDYNRIKPAGENKYGPFEVVSESEFPDNDFVNELKTETITGHKFNDLNANGVWDEGEPGLEDWTIKLQVADEMPNSAIVANSEVWSDFDETLTGEGGAYTFENVPADKTYRVVEELQPGWTQSMPDDPNYYTVEPDPGAELGPFDFGNWTNGTVFGFKFEDINEDGEWDKEAVPPEIGLSGWTIEARDAEGQLADSAVTGEGGYYSLSLPPGTYTLTEVLKTDADWKQTAPEGGSFTVTVTSDGEFGPYNFGNVAVLFVTPPTFDKSADKTTAIPGEIVTYTLTYTNKGDADIEAPFEIVDNYDQRYIGPVELNGGVDNGDTITWTDEEPLAPGQSRSITYTMRVHSEMPEGTTLVKNTAVLNWVGGTLTDTWTVSVKNPVTPVTGIELGLLALFAVLALAGSVVLRIAARKA